MFFGERSTIRRGFGAREIVEEIFGKKVLEFGGPTSPCLSLARDICQEAQENGQGGTAIILYGEERGHISFIPRLSPEEIKQGSFEVTDLWGKRKYASLIEYAVRVCPAGREITVEVGPGQDFDRTIIEGINEAVSKPSIFEQFQQKIKSWY